MEGITIKKRKYISFFFIILILLIILLIVILYNKFICKYDGQEIQLIKNDNVAVYLERINYDSEDGPKLVFKINGDDTYSTKIIIKSIDGLNQLHSIYNIGVSDNKEFEVDLYTYYMRDLEALNLEENKKSLQMNGYTISDYKEAFLNVKSIEIDMEVYKIWTEGFYNDDGIGTSTPYQEKIADIHKFIKINGEKSSSIKQIYNNIDILQKYDVMQAPENAEWKSFEQIVPSEVLEKIDKVILNGVDQGNVENILGELKAKQYAEYPNGIPMYDGEKEKYRILDNNGEVLLEIDSCYIEKQEGASTVEELEIFYKIIYQDEEVYYWIK